MKDAGKRRLLILTGIFLLLILVFAFYYASFLRDEARERTVAVLNELSNQNAAILQAEVDRGLDELQNVAGVVEHFGLQSSTDIVAYLRTLLPAHNYLRMGVAGPDGVAHTTDEQRFSILDRPYFNAAFEGMASVSDALQDKVGGEPIIVYGAPIRLQGEVRFALFATYSVHNYAQALSTPTFDGDGYNYVVTRAGDCVAGSLHAASFGLSFGNFFDRVEQASDRNAQAVQKLRADLNAAKSGVLEFYNEGEGKYVYYQPIGVNDWYILTIVPETVISAQTRGMLSWSYFFILCCTIALILLILANLRTRLAGYVALERMAFVDELTGGPSYNKFKLEARARVKADPQMRHCMVSLDVNNFQYVNDVFGYEEGDAMLRFLYEAIRAGLNEGELAAREYADHFVALVAYRQGIEELQPRFLAFAERLKDYRPACGCGAYNLSAAAGVYPVEAGVTDVDAMVNRAKIPQKRIKGNAATLYAVYTDELRRQLLAQKQLENRFDQALAGREFLVFYQPKFNLAHRRFAGAEALVRWRDETGRLLPPGEFVPVFERNGDIVRLDQYVLDTVCQDIRRWLNEGRRVVPVSVNVSRLQLLGEGFVETYLRIINEHQVPLHLIQLEFTESLMVENEQVLISVAEALHRAGVMVLMDDFGSGYSSLNMLKCVPLDVLKLDKRFVDDLGRDEKSSAVVEGAITLTHTLGLTATAEGVETKAQFDILARFGCDDIQGYYCARPMPAVQFEEILTDSRPGE